MPLHHVALRCAHPAEVSRFYREALGLPLLRITEQGSHWLDLGGGAVLMIEPRAEGEPAVPAGSMDFFAVATDAPGLTAFEKRCEALGVTIEHRTAHTRYARDPEGRRAGVSSYPFDENG